MAPSQTTSPPDRYAAPYKAADFGARLRDIDMFFQGNDRVHETMNRVARRLEAAEIPYAIVGGMAVNAHGHQRTTGDVDFLLTAASFNAFLKIVASGEFTRILGRPRRFLDPLTGIPFEREKLAPSIRGDYVECLEEKRREDEYEARQDEQFEQKTREAELPPESGSS